MTHLPHELTKDQLEPFAESVLKESWSSLIICRTAKPDSSNRDQAEETPERSAGKQGGRHLMR